MVKIHTDIINTRKGQQRFWCRIKCPELKRDWHIVNPKLKICKHSACGCFGILLCRKPEVTIQVHTVFAASSGKRTNKQTKRKIITLTNLNILCRDLSNYIPTRIIIHKIVMLGACRTFHLRVNLACQKVRCCGTGERQQSQQVLYKFP